MRATVFAAGVMALGVVALGPISAGAVSQGTSDPQGLELLAKHRAFVGWQFGDGSFHTMRVTGNVTDEHGKQEQAFMAILDPNADLSAEKGLPMMVDLSQSVPIVPMVLNKSTPVNAALDTGNPGIILFGSDLISKYHFKVFNGCANIESLSIGPIVYTAESACEYGMAADYMLLGFDFLKHFDFVFDYPHGRMFMRPNKN